MAMNVTAEAAHCVLSFSLQGSAEAISITLGVHRPPEASPDAVASGVYAAFTGASAPFVPANMMNVYTFNGVEAFIGAPGEVEQGAWFQPVVGAASSSGLPPNCAVLIKKNTALGGRRMRGRMYMPPVQCSEAQVNQLGVIDSATVAFMQGTWNAAKAALVTANLSPLLFHSLEPGLIVPTPITSFTVTSLLATQRRRMR